MTDHKLAAAQREAFLESIQEPIEHVLKIIDWKKIHEHSYADLFTHFQFITAEAWEEYRAPADVIAVNTRAMMSALHDFKESYDALKEDDDVQNFQTSDYKTYLEAVLKETMQNTLVSEVEKSKHAPEGELDDAIKLAQSFNLAARELKSRIILDYDPTDTKSQSEVLNMAHQYGRVISNQPKLTESQNIILRKVLEAEALTALTQLHQEPANDDRVKEIVKDVRKNVLASIFDIAESTQMMPETLRDLDTATLGFKAPARQL